MRDVADRYPKTYQKIGKTLVSLGYDIDPCSTYRHTPKELHRMFLAIIAAMPPHVKPYWSLGIELKWGEIDWSTLLASFAEEVA